MTALSRATRRIVVAHLTDRGMKPAEIASELGVSPDTVRRDLDALRQDPPDDAQPDAAPAKPIFALAEDTQLRQDLNLLAASYKAPAEDVTRQLLHREAEAIRARVRARFSATAGA
ncbi:helix-turn-helix domain-containing protein [Streptomyces albicerus]|uniref:helix-turn-helix domain-containing protein n=1 Tax=Streptomyces albicerus TaxID=2569859 RepID=UPI00124B3607|nr:helix-turn-helix domain-containing protein [Streptomyces albicerus]